MNDHIPTQKEETIEFEYKLHPLIYLSLPVGFVLVLLALWGERNDWGNTALVLFTIIGSISFLFGSGAVLMAKVLKPKVALSPVGIWHTTFKNGMIFWKDITKIHCKKNKHAHILLIYTKQPEKYAYIQAPKAKWAAGLSDSSYGTHLGFSLQAMPKAFYSSLKTHLKAYAVNLKTVKGINLDCE